MKKKIVGIFVCTLLIITIFPAIGLADANKIKTNYLTYNENNFISFYKTSNYNGVSNEKSNAESNGIIYFENYNRNGDVLDQQQTSYYAYNQGWGVIENEWIAQGFTPTLDILTRVQLFMFKTGMVSGIQVTVSIRESLNGNDLTNISVNGSEIGYSASWIEFDFADISVIPGHTYFIVARAPEADEVNAIAWNYDINNPYEDGDAWCAFSPQFDWFLIDGPDFPKCDCCFMTFGLDEPPNAPTIEGKIEGKIDTVYNYTFVTTDPEGHDVYYYIKWGDNTNSTWLGPYSSGKQITIAHSWDKKGKYTIEVKAKDAYGAESNWSHLDVTMPKNKNQQSTQQSSSLPSSITSDTTLSSQKQLEGPALMDLDTLFEDSFENYSDFKLVFPPWIQIDGDGAETMKIEPPDFPNEGYIGSYIIFNPSKTIPPVTDAPPHSGDKYAACFDASNTDNDDWLITPQLSADIFCEVSFWARSYSSNFLDRFEVGISTTGTNKTDFTIISDPPYIEPPTYWNQYEYDLSSYSGSVYIAIHCVTWFGVFLMVDDFSVTQVILKPDLFCIGNLKWEDVKPGETIDGSFIVQNIGEPGSYLDWEIIDYPEWGEWTFNPENGSDLPRGYSNNVSVKVVAPDEPNKKFLGKLKVINCENSDDFCEIDVVLKTPKNKTFIFHYNLLDWLFERYPNAFPLLHKIILRFGLH
jgi:hypothetical protein